ncbi:facilitated trehalose transporter Tret1-like [Anticarsia gemmatalis]|uniref:facilitated trehalose transporter Tret1-like n=1 Tax=Anticarsia gemmatalis TaxID=129554 RepID=UPI003F76AE78
MKKSQKMQYLVSFAVSLSAITIGVTVAWSTPVLPKFHNNETGINITEHEISWVAAISSPGFMTGGLMTRHLADRIGRRTTLLGSAFPLVVGAVIILTTSSAWLIYVTRFLWGIGNGMIASVSSMYLSEISDKEIRGRLLTVNRFMTSFGNFIVMCVGPFISYKALSSMLLVLPISYFVACCFIPETPYYLLKEGKVEAARQALVKLSGNQDDKVLEDRLTAMRSDVRKEMLRSGSLKELLTGKQYRKALIIVIGLKCTQILAGSLAITQYLGRITQETDTSLSMSTVLIVFGALRLVTGVFLSVIVDKVGRKPLLLYSYLGSAITLVIVGAYFFIQPTSSSFYGYIPFIAIIAYTVISNLGYNSLVNTILAEVFPMNVKSVGTTLTLILGGFLNFLAVKGYQAMKDISGLTGVFWFYGSWALFGAVFTHFVVLETKGKSLREIQIELQGDIYDEAGEKLNQAVANNDVEATELKNLETK